MAVWCPLQDTYTAAGEKEAAAYAAAYFITAGQNAIRRSAERSGRDCSLAVHKQIHSFTEAQKDSFANDLISINPRSSVIASASHGTVGEEVRPLRAPDTSSLSDD